MTGARIGDVFRAVQDMRADVKKKGDFSCSFCGRLRTQVERLISGPAVFICTGCIKQARAAQAAGTGIEAGECRFCGKSRDEVKYMFARNDARICEECLELSEEMAAEGQDT